MPTATRRAFLAGAAGLGAATLIPSTARAATIPTVREDHRVVVIGSGFGGGVTALRLAQAGVPVTVLERGRWWHTGPNAETFPHPGEKPNDKRLLFYGTTPSSLRGLQTLVGTPIDLEPYVGLLEPVLGTDMLAMCAAGVGGGSLVYQGMTLQPAKEAFLEVLPEALDYDTMDRTYYPRVAAMLHADVAPDSLVDSPSYLAARTFKRQAEEAGFDVEKIPMPIDWSYALAELKGRMKPSYTNGDCSLGVNNGGKHSVDVTYIKKALATGRVTVRTLHNVTSVAQGRNGTWTVHVDRTDTAGNVLEHKILTTKALVMAAGSLNTTRLLVRAKALGDIEDMPDGVGTQWGTNGDRIYMWTDLTTDFGPTQGGPVIYGSKEWHDPSLANTIIQASMPPTALGDIRTTTLVGFGTSTGRGKLVYDGLLDSVELVFPRGADARVHARIAERLAATVGLSGVLEDTYLAMPSTWHPLGGAPMGSVCDLEGRVHDQPGLYVLDGALIPGSTAACNPSMTIAALAERALDRIVRRDVGTVI